MIFKIKHLNLEMKPDVRLDGGVLVVPVDISIECIEGLDTSSLLAMWITEKHFELKEVPMDVDHAKT